MRTSPIIFTVALGVLATFVAAAPMSAHDALVGRDEDAIISSSSFGRRAFPSLTKSKPKKPESAKKKAAADRPSNKDNRKGDKSKPKTDSRGRSPTHRPTKANEQYHHAQSQWNNYDSE